MNDASQPASANAALHVARFLAAPAATMPRFAADGRLWFLCDAPGSAQVFELKPGLAGPPVQRSVHRDAVTVLAGRGAFDFAVFARDAGGNERHQLHLLPAIGEPRALTDDPGTIHGWGAISPDGTQIAFVANNRDPAHTDPWVLELASGTPRRVAMVQGPHELPCWHPSGQAIVIEAAPRSFESTLLLVNVHSGAITPLTPHTGDWRHTGPRWRTDGRAFWLRTDRDREFLGVAMMEPGGAPRWLYVPEHDVEIMEPSPDEMRLALVVNENGFSRLRVIDAMTGAILAEPTYPEGTITALSWSPDGASIAFDLANPTTPAAIWLAPAAGGAARELYRAAPPPDGARPYQLLHAPSVDGLNIPLFLAEPAGPQPASGWPVLIWVHGGPVGQSLPTWRPDLQALLAAGIAVAIPNVRGSSGYGRAYAALDDREKRLDAVADLAAVRNFLGTRAGLDGARVAVMGQSYGGWMVLAAMTEYPELWAAGVEFYGIARWKTFFERTGPWRIGHRAAEYGDPVADAALLERLSPLNHVDRIAAPLLVAQGMTDPRVPPFESEQIVAALKARGIPVRYVTFPDEGHGFTKRDNRQAAYTEVVAFLSRHLGTGRT
jgi:dipeptidyl aminopeptidase/acylaminoacyl peptidase